MLCPEVWSFLPPDHYYKFNRGNFLKGESNKCSDLINFHFFNHLVSVVLPDAINVPELIKDSLNEDCDYYKVENLHISELICKEFIEAFVKKGRLSVLSHGKCIDTDDCVALTPSGHLVLSLKRETYQQLGLEGRPSFFWKTNPQKYVVQLDLKEDNFTPGKKNYERVQHCLKENFQLKMNFLIAWDPPEEKICPSSVAAHFSSREYKVSLCEPVFSKQVSYNVKVPVFPQDTENSSMMELMEWLGGFCIGADLEPDESNSYINTYTCPLETMEIGAVTHTKWTGYFTVSQIHNLFDQLRIYVSHRPKIPWVSMYVQGFADSPVSWNLKEHQYYTDGDNNYVIFIRSDGNYSSCSYISSNKRPKHKMKK